MWGFIRIAVKFKRYGEDGKHPGNDLWVDKIPIHLDAGYYRCFGVGGPSVGHSESLVVFKGLFDCCIFGWGYLYGCRVDKVGDGRQKRFAPRQISLLDSNPVLKSEQQIFY